MIDSVVICERLASLARSGYAVRGALLELPRRIEAYDGAVVAAARRASLGAPIASCLDPLVPHFGDTLPELRACLEGSASSGTNWATAVEDIAASIRERRCLKRSAEVAGAGATLSARIIAALPLLMAPIGLRQISDEIVAVSIGLGVLLGVAGYRWLVRVVPRPPADDQRAVIADEVAASVEAGWPLGPAFDRALASREGFARPSRLAHLGTPWATALSRDLPALAVAIADAERTGTPTARSLRRTAASLRQQSKQDFERDVQRTPVRMVLPLVLCCLPAFVLVAIVPLLRGLAQPV